jgi:hypothetical protein
MPSNTPAPPEKIYEAPSGGYDHAIRTSSPSYNSSPIPTRRIGLSKDHYVSRPPAMLEQFQEKCEAVFRPELRKNKRIERFCASVKS